jgi:hypothetical protein
MIRHDALPKSQAARDRYDTDRRRSQERRARRSTGYRHDSDAHAEAREKVDADLRREIASAGGRARAAMYGHTGEADTKPTARPPMPDVWSWPPGGHPKPTAARIAAAITRSEKPTPEQVKRAAAARAAASRPARRAAQRAREAAKKGKR